MTRLAKKDIQIGVQKLTSDDLLKLSKFVDETLKEKLLEEIGAENLLDFDITVDLTLNDELQVSVDVNVNVTPLLEDHIQDIVDNSLEYVFNLFEQKLKEVIEHAKTSKEPVQSSERTVI